MGGNAVAVQNTNALAPYIEQEKIDLIKRQVFPNATDLELEMFITLANTKRLDPLTNQIYAIKYGNEKAAMFASIDGLRVIAKRAGDYGGQTQPYWCGPDKVWTDVWLDSDTPVAAKVGVYIKGCDHPTWGVAHWKSYAFDRKGQAKGNNWKSMPEVMLAKCAESIALRKAFPDDISGLYIREEFGVADEPPRSAQAQESRPAPIAAEVVNQETGEIETVESVAADIREAREALGWSARDVQDDADREGINIRKREGLVQMRDRLQSMVTASLSGAPAAAEIPFDMDAEYAVAGEAGHDKYTET